MARRSNWLPGQPAQGREPGRQWDDIGIGPAQSSRTPLEYAISGGLLVVGAIATLVVGFVMGMTQIVSAFVFFLAIALVFVAAAVWLFVIAYRRQAWRRRYAQRTGAPLLKPWEKTPDGYR